MGLAAGKSLLLGRILFIGGLVLLHNGEESVIQSSLKDVTSVLLDELIGLACILPCIWLLAVLLNKLPSCIHASQTQLFLLDESGGSKAAFPQTCLPLERGLDIGDVHLLELLLPGVGLVVAISILIT